MKITVEKAALSHLEEIGRLYDTLCEQLRSGRNYPGWQKGVYPTAADAERGNEPAERLCRRCGFQYVGAASPGYEAYGLPWFELDEKML